MFLLRHPLLFLLLLCSGPWCQAQPVIGDSTYLRIPDREKALEAMRFDMAAYADTLRVYRDAVDVAATRIDAGSQAGQERKARLGLVRRDARLLSKDMKHMRKRLKRSPPSFEECARTCSDLVRRTRLLRTALEREGARPAR